MWVAVVAIGDTFPSWVQMLPLKCRVQRRERASGERVRVARIIIVATCRNGAPDTETAALAPSLPRWLGEAAMPFARSPQLL